MPIRQSEEVRKIRMRQNVGLHISVAASPIAVSITISNASGHGPTVAPAVGPCSHKAV